MIKHGLAGLALAAAIQACGAQSTGNTSATPLTVGTPAMGTLGATSTESTIPGRSSTNTYRRDLYAVELTAGMPVTILMCRTGTEQLDTYVAIHGPMGAADNVMVNDDAAGMLNARLVYTPTSSGTHTLYATTFALGGNARGTGSYTLTVFAGAMPMVTCPAP